jgi:hypothetical protein
MGILVKGFVQYMQQVLIYTIFGFFGSAEYKEGRVTRLDCACKDRSSAIQTPDLRRWTSDSRLLLAGKTVLRSFLATLS